MFASWVKSAEWIKQEEKNGSQQLSDIRRLKTHKKHCIRFSLRLTATARWFIRMGPPMQAAET